MFVIARSMYACNVGRLGKSFGSNLKHRVGWHSFQNGLPQGANRFITGQRKAEPSNLREVAPEATQVTNQSQEPANVPVMGYNQEHYNMVKITGIACEDPNIYTTKNGEKGARLKLGQMNPGKMWPQAFQLYFNESIMSTVKESLRSGAHIAVIGYLTEYKRVVSINVHDFYVVGDKSPFGEGEVQKIMNYVNGSANDNAGGYGSSQTGWPSLVSPSKLACHKLLTEEKMPTPEIAKARNVKEPTVIGYLAELGAAGYPIDWRQLCLAARLGPTGSEFITVDEINQVIDEMVENKAVGVEAFHNDYVQKIRMMLLRSIKAKIAAQETTQVRPGWIYAQIRVVLALKALGQGPPKWNGYLIEPSAPF